MNIVFIGPPLAGKGTQAKLLSIKLRIPVFSIGALLREYAKDDYKQYAMKGQNLPVVLKFNLLKEKLDNAKNGFILENFPAAEDDLMVFIDYLNKHKLTIDKAFNITISEEETKKRMKQRGRIDDDTDIVKNRMAFQGKDRKIVLDYFSKMGVLVTINGEGSVEEIHKRVIDSLSL